MKHTVSLNKNELFLQVYRKGQRSYHKNFTLHYLPNGSDCNRLGIKTGRKLAGAIMRNRIRRLIKESYRLTESEIKTGYDLVIAAKEGALCAASLTETQKALHHLLKAAHLLAVPPTKQAANPNKERSPL